MRKHLTCYGEGISSLTSRAEEPAAKPVQLLCAITDEAVHGMRTPKFIQASEAGTIEHIIVGIPLMTAC